MSGIKDQALSRFYRKLHARPRAPRTVEQLAGRLLLNRQHLTEVINGTRPGRRTWPRLAKLLTVDELRLLGRDKIGEPRPAGGLILASGFDAYGVPQETLSHLRQFTEASA
jgi:hypothetical protein